MNRTVFAICGLLLVYATPGQTLAQSSRGILGQRAPQWGVDQWINLPDGKKQLNPSDLQGKVLYLLCFQSWCPGCHSRGFPMLQEMKRRYQKDPDVAFVAIQTAFEGFFTNTFAQAQKVADQYELKIPVGHSGDGEQKSQLMSRYRTGGTPWVVIIDRVGVVRYNDFHIKKDVAVLLVDRLLAEPTGGEKSAIPASRAGRNLIGKPLSLGGLQWINTPEGKAVELKGRVTLVHWWTDTGPHCGRSLPAIDRLRKQFASRGLQTIAVYHPEPLHDVSRVNILKAARESGYNGVVATDMQRRTLQRVYPKHNRDAPTDVSFILDRSGVVRYVDPGPVFFPSEEPDSASANRDFSTVERVIGQILDES